jgi:DNA-binding MarR family transcriptional regulator
VADAIDHSALGHLLGYAMARADVHVRPAFQACIGEPLQLRPVEFSLLVLLLSNEDVTQTRLTRALAMSAPNLTTLVDRLVERGLVERVRSEQDRRAQLVCLTAAGRALATRAHELSRTMEDEALCALSAAERAILLELLHRVGRSGGG